jgi:8-oxo-dGTP pyrophosphatase MutT (NUDIX family)
MKIFEVTQPKAKAGIIPWIEENGIIQMMFMIPSDPHYGGPNPQIAKGGVDMGEDTKTAAIREGNEELGLLESNIDEVTFITTEKITGLDETYTITIYAAKVKDKKNFTSPHFETGKTMWLTNKEFQKVGRKIHKGFVSQTFTKLNI